MKKKFRTVINPQDAGYSLVQRCLVFNEEGEQVEIITNPEISHADIDSAWASATSFINQHKG
jgi:hypothetical protein